jgi:hypothetical protein
MAKGLRAKGEKRAAKSESRKGNNGEDIEYCKGEQEA